MKKKEEKGVNKKAVTLVLSGSVQDAVKSIAGDENLTTTAMYRKLLISGLKADYGIEVKNNKVITPNTGS